MAQDREGGKGDGDLDQDSADRQEPDFVPRLFIHAATTLKGGN